MSSPTPVTALKKPSAYVHSAELIRVCAWVGGGRKKISHVGALGPHTPKSNQKKQDVTTNKVT
jgi:hypothetical protein